MKRRRLLVLASYPPRMAATRFRACAYFPALAASGIDADLRPFMDDTLAANFYAKGQRLRKAARLMLGALRRIRQLTTAGHYDAVFVQREAAIVGPALFETALREWLRVPLVFDFDDAIWTRDRTGSRHPLASRLLEYPSKTQAILRMADEVVVASNYLADYARPRARRVTVLPTVVSSAKWTPLPCRAEGHFASGDGIPTVGWIGTHSTALHLDMVVPSLVALAREGLRFRVRLVGAARTLDVPGVPVEVLPWREETEVSDFQNIDVGIAPVVDNEWARGKGGFKQIQYMTVGVPFVSSPVGGATEFLVDGVNGLVARGGESWTNHLRALLTDRNLRARLSREGRRHAAEELCLEVQARPFVEVIERAMASSPSRAR